MKITSQEGYSFSWPVLICTLSKMLVMCLLDFEVHYWLFKHFECVIVIYAQPFLYIILFQKKWQNRLWWTSQDQKIVNYFYFIYFFKYSFSLNKGHLKTRHSWTPDNLVFGNKMVHVLNTRHFSLVLRCCSKYEPLIKQTCFDHLKIRFAWNSDCYWT